MTAATERYHGARFPDDAEELAEAGVQWVERAVGPLTQRDDRILGLVWMGVQLCSELIEEQNEDEVWGDDDDDE